MPITACTVNGKPGLKWGKSGKCYTYIPGNQASRDNAKKKALLQAIAIGKGKIRVDAQEKVPRRFSFLTQPELQRAILRANRRLPKMLPPKKIERGYSRELRLLVRRWKDLYLQMVDPFLEQIAAEAYLQKPASAGVKTDAWPTKLDNLLAGYYLQVDETLKASKPLAIRVGEQTNAWNEKQWNKVVTKVMGAPMLLSEPWLTDQIASFSSQNVDLISNLAEETKRDIGRITKDGFQRGKRVETIRKDILSNNKLTPGRFRKTRTRADLIAVDQTNKLNGQLTQIRQNEIGIERYTWQTVADEKTRTSHLAMQGLLCRWDDSTVYSDDGGKTWISRGNVGGVEVHPGQDYRCRCFADADFSTILEEAA